MTRSVLLDLDGTIVDSQPGILASTLAALAALGHRPGPDFDIKTVIGPPLDDMLRVVLQPFGDARVDEAVLAYRAHYGTSGLYDSVAYDGIGEALAAMRRAGLRLFLATSKREEFAIRILQHLDFAQHFEAMHGSVPGGARDHKPELLSYIVSTHGLAPQSCVMVGDRRYDIAGAHAAGMRGLGALWGYGAREELETAGADALVETPAGLPVAVLSALDAAR